nr:unnamed protein product [Callosobruchus chinensis]
MQQEDFLKISEMKNSFRIPRGPDNACSISKAVRMMFTTENMDEIRFSETYTGPFQSYSIKKRGRPVPLKEQLTQQIPRKYNTLLAIDSSKLEHMSGTTPRDPYEEEQNRLLQIYNELTSSASEPDPFADDEGEFGSDKDYKPSSESSNLDSSTPEFTVDGVDPLNVTEPEVELSEIHDMDDDGSEIFCCSDENSKKKDKVQPFIDLLLASFQDAYGPKKELSIDESLLHFRGIHQK